MFENKTSGFSWMASSSCSFCPHISNYFVSPIISIFSLLRIESTCISIFLISVLIVFVAVLTLFFWKKLIGPTFSTNIFSNPAQANTSSACTLKGNGNAELKIRKRDLKIPKILSITFLKDAWRKLNNSFRLLGSQPWPPKSCRWYFVALYGAKKLRRFANLQSTR